MEAFFLGLFLFGALFTVASLVLGHAHGGHDLSAAHDGFAHDGLLGHVAAPILNASSLIGFVTWFGAAGYVLLRVSDLALIGVLIGATIGGAAGAYLIARFLRLVLAGERVMDPDDYRLEGTVGQVTVGIPAGGTGEVVFSKAGARRSEAARAISGASIPRGTEVVITRFDHGFATVQPWAEFVASDDKEA
jgi:hypothetical protein